MAQMDLQSFPWITTISHGKNGKKHFIRLRDSTEMHRIKEMKALYIRSQDSTEMQRIKEINESIVLNKCKH
jgi:hypothetical protein